MAAKQDCCSLRSVCWIPTLMPRDAKLYSNRAAALTKVWLMLVSGCISHKKHLNWCSVSKTSKYQVSREKKTQSFPQLLAYPDALRDLDECLKTLRQVLRSRNTEWISSFAVQIWRFPLNVCVIRILFFQAGAKLYQGLFQEGSRPLFHEGVPQGCSAVIIFNTLCNEKIGR